MAKIKKIELKKCDENSPYWSTIEYLFQSEWSDFKLSDSAELPPVIIALADGKVIGGLAYSRYQELHGNDEVIWVNAVFVCSEWRGQGIASKLINLGVEQVSVEVQSRLYAHTNIPNLYIALGWSVVDTESEPNHKVMSVATEP